MKFNVVGANMLLAAMMLTGCPTSTDTDTDIDTEVDTEVEDVDVSVTVTTAPPATVVEDVEFGATWEIAGTGVIVVHTNMHCCPAAEPTCAAASAGGTRVDSPVQGTDASGDGATGSYSTVLTMPDAGSFACSIHSKLQEPTLPAPTDYHNEFDLTVTAANL